MMRPARLFVAIVFLTLACLPLRAADTVEIQQHWQAGKRYYQTMRTEQSTNVAFGDQKVEQTMTMTAEMTMTVSRPEAGQPKRLTMRYGRMAAQLVMNGQKMGFDSADPSTSDDPLGLSKTLGPLVGKELKAVLNEKDEVVSIENYDEFVKNMTSAVSVPGMDWSKMFSKERLSQMVEQGFLHTTPGKPVAIGETWPFETHLDLSPLGEVSMKGMYTLKSVGLHDGTNCAEIVTEGTLTMDLEHGGAVDKSSPGADLGMEVSGGTIKGTIWFDPQLGFARDTQFVQEMKMSMKNPADESAKIEIPMKQTISVVLTKIEDVK
jgi:hypothetical protein